MRQSFTTMAAMLGLLALAAPAIAQAYYLPKKLSASDMQMLTIEGNTLTPGGKQTGAWSNPKTGHSGTAAILKKTEKKGMHCELYEYTFRTGTSSDNTPYKLNWCKTDTAWKIAN
ncbi:hypothetical protein [Acidisoma cladoniae]|uniref:hypothetical protein n=1 Tax=Acidisoma cladoniae TaxID=3040935 RepID=UPI00254F1897|nr:hypothetical protein [Acidisoma sp. PAMC 29798]